MRKKTMSIALCLIMSLAVLGGCGQGSAPAPSAAPSQPAAATPSQPAAAAPSQAPAPAPDASYKKEVVVAYNSQITNTDPQSINNVQHKRIFLLTHSTLTYRHPETGELMPWLAESWEMQDDLITWNIKLREGVKFHNGETLTADDVVFTIERGKETAIGSARNMFLYADTITAIDDNNVQIVLTSPNMDWIDILSQPAFSILNRKAVEADETHGPEVGTGAWKYKEFVDGDYIVLERFDDFWGEAPKTEVLRLRTIPEASARLIALQNGEIDVCLDVNNSEIGFVAEDKNLTLTQYTGTSLAYFAFNVSKAPGNNDALRQAVSHAINVDDIILGAYEGYGTKATSFWNWQQYGYNENIPPYEYNVELAKQIVKDNGLEGTGLAIMASNREYITVAEIIQAQLAEIGIVVSVTEVDSAGFTSQTNAGDHEACIYGITFTTFGDDARRAYLSGSTTNKSFQNNPRIHELMDLGLMEADETQRLAYYHEWQEAAHEEIAVIPLIYKVANTATNKDAGGILFEPGGIHDFSHIYVTQ